MVCEGALPGETCPANPLLCFDGLSTNGKTSIFLMSIPFALSMSKGELGFAGQALYYFFLHTS